MFSSEWLYTELYLMDSGYSFSGVPGSPIIKLATELHLLEGALIHITTVTAMNKNFLFMPHR
jgi:hypothetical protein